MTRGCGYARVSIGSTSAPTQAETARKVQFRLWLLRLWPIPRHHGSITKECRAVTACAGTPWQSMAVVAPRYTWHRP